MPNADGTPIRLHRLDPSTNTDKTPVHTNTRPFCDNFNCACHLGEDAQLLLDLFADGLMTNDEGIRIMEGKQDFR